MRKRLAVAWAMGLAMAASGAQAQNRDLRLLTPPAASVAFEPDDFSALDTGYVSLGKYQTYYYAGFELGLSAVVDKAEGTALFTLRVLAPGLKVPGNIVSVAARGGVLFEDLGASSGPVSCNRYSCRHNVAGDYLIPDSVLKDLRTGKETDIRVTTSCGTECDVILPVTPRTFEILDRWVASRSKGASNPSPPIVE